MVYNFGYILYQEARKLRIRELLRKRLEEATSSTIASPDSSRRYSDYLILRAKKELENTSNRSDKIDSSEDQKSDLNHFQSTKPLKKKMIIPKVNT